MKEWTDLKWHSQIGVPKMVALIERKGGICLPGPEFWFRAFDLTPFERVKVVILGQDPYPTPGHAMGLAFSVPHGTKPLPPSLGNILNELREDIGNDCVVNGHGDLTSWATQGVLLLNTSLTTEPHKPNAHAGLGWEGLVWEAIHATIAYRRNIAFVLWGTKAYDLFSSACYMGAMKEGGHKAFKSVHPSPMSARNGFFGSRPFSKVNQFLVSTGQSPVDWRIR